MPKHDLWDDEDYEYETRKKLTSREKALVKSYGSDFRHVPLKRREVSEDDA